MRKKLLLLTCATLLLPASVVLALPIDQLVVFGDSLSDTGNAYIATGGAVAAAPAYQNGRFTDGPDTLPSTNSPTGLWIDQFASKMNLGSPTAALAGGTNYAVGSAQTGTNPAYNGKSPEAPYVDQQVALYTAGSKVSSTALYTFWAGSDDLYAGKNPLTAASNLSANIATLANGGAKNFLWLNLPLLGDVPDATKLGPVLSAALNAEAVAFNTAYSAAIPLLEAQYGVNIISVDVYQLFTQILANPSAYGFTNTTDAAQGLAGVNPNNYAFWDGLHPTTAADALVANLAFNDVQAAFAPEPAAMGLMAFGVLFMCVLGLVRTRRGKSV
ncbi:MAG TPA: SGNH/GDSL hydrolase family protein [Bryobacteraceae bacterium]|nr:SGNH/GDSL hydrolase family protein [Bryobacteraceae bacterium]